MTASLSRNWSLWRYNNHINHHAPGNATLSKYRLIAMTWIDEHINQYTVSTNTYTVRSTLRMHSIYSSSYRNVAWRGVRQKLEELKRWTIRFIITVKRTKSQGGALTSIQMDQCIISYVSVVALQYTAAVSHIYIYINQHRVALHVVSPNARAQMGPRHVAFPLPFFSFPHTLSRCLPCANGSTRYFSCCLWPLSVALPLTLKSFMSPLPLTTAIFINSNSLQNKIIQISIFSNFLSVYASSLPV